MYGYVVPVKTELDCRDFGLYRSFYCGMCKLTGRFYGQLPRLTTNYDITFLSVLLHEYTKTEYVFEHKGCVLNPFKKKTSVCANGLFEKIAAANIILSYYKASDGVLDKEGIKYRVVKSMLKKPYRKAALKLPGVDGACKTWYDKLRKLEKTNCSSPDRAADCFANMLKDTAAAILDTAASPDLLSLCYNVGKFVYLADALDDVGEDCRKKRYNPFLAAYGECEPRKNFSRAAFIEKNREDLTFILASAVNRAIECFNNIRSEFASGGPLLQNILYSGLRAKCGEILDSPKKLKNPRI